MAKKQPVKSAPRPKSKRKPIKFRQVSFKLTEYQKKALEKYCKTNKLTPVRFMKSLINGHVERYREQVPTQSYVTDNQLELFGADDSV
jgi:hypothetical protein